MEDRRRDDQILQLSKSMAAMEVTQKLYHDEIKAIIEKMHNDLSSMKITLYGDPEQDRPGLVDRFRALVVKMAAFGSVVGLLLKFFGPSISKAAQDIISSDKEEVHTRHKR